MNVGGTPSEGNPVLRWSYGASAYREPRQDVKVENLEGQTSTFPFYPHYPGTVVTPSPWHSTGHYPVTVEMFSPGAEERTPKSIVETTRKKHAQRLEKTVTGNYDYPEENLHLDEDSDVSKQIESA